MAGVRGRAATEAQNAPKCILSRPTGPMTLILDNFPSPDIARALSPNGRTHWAEKKRAREAVQVAFYLAALQQGLDVFDGQVRITYRWVFPDHRARDLDNLSTGVVKALQDCLVKADVIRADDTSCVVGMSVEVSVEKGRRALVVTVQEG